MYYAHEQLLYDPCTR